MEETQRHTLTKAERLTGRTRIAELFEQGRGDFLFPFRYIVRQRDNLTTNTASTPSPSASECSSPEVPPLQTLTDEKAQSGCSLLISVSKRYHKRANKRNLLKRRIREAYRLHNAPLKERLATTGKSIDLALIYSTKEILEYKTIEYAVRKIITTISENL